MARIKGTALNSRCHYVVRHHGEAAFEEVLARLGKPEYAEVLRKGVLKSEWYPFELYLELIRHIDAVCGTGDGSLYPVMAAQAAQDDLTTIYKVFFRIATPAFILSKARRIWSQYYDTGELVVVEHVAGRAIMEVRDFEAPHRAHCSSIAGWMQQCIVMTGASDAAVQHLSCRAQGDQRCMFSATWTGR